MLIALGVRGLTGFELVRPVKDETCYHILKSHPEKAA
jgi:hypothetical protein